ncbi:MAG: hypothetical protein ACOC23_07770 [Thermodesulfobacteriota bacterium]
MGRILLLVFLALFLILASTRKWKLFFGLCLASGVLAVILLFGTVRNTEQKNSPGPKLETVHILFSEDKKGLIQDSAFRDLLKTRFGWVVIGEKYGPEGIPAGALEGVDGVWAIGPFLETIIENFSSENSGSKANVFSSPLVIYSWSDILYTLIGEGIAKIRNDVPYLTDFPRLLQLMREGRTWNTLGLRNMEGTVVLRTADPAESPVGRLCAYLIAEALPDTPSGASNSSLPTAGLKQLYEIMGPLPDSEEALFSKFLKQGPWAYPFAMATESQIIAFYQAFPAYREKMESRIRVLYPEPTLDIPHPFVAFTPKGKRLLDALNSEEVQQFAAKIYGYRPVSDSLPSPAFLKMPRLENLLASPSESRLGKMKDGLNSLHPQ